MLPTMSATIIPFPDRRTAVATIDHRWDDEDWFERAQLVLDQVEDLLGERSGADIRALCEKGIRCVLEAAPEIDDADAVHALVERLCELHLRACELDRLAGAGRPSAG